MKLSNKFFIAGALVLSMSLIGCDSIKKKIHGQKDNTQEEKEWVTNEFLKEHTYMTEREALSKEIDYYRPPKMVCNKTLCKLSGRDLIHIANEISKENEKRKRPENQLIVGWSIQIEVSSVKEVGMNNPDGCVGTLYLLGGDFVHWANGAKRIYEFVIYIPSIGRYLEASYRNLPVRLQDSLKMSEGAWIQDIPIYDNIDLW